MRAVRRVRVTGQWKHRGTDNLSRRPNMGEWIDKAKGKIKQVVAGVTGDDKLRREGKLDVNKGRAKGAGEDLKKAIKGD